MDAAYKQFIATNDEKTVLDAAKRMAAGRPNLTYAGEIDALKQTINTPARRRSRRWR
jgi:hypothetical protein